jgi:outer membrane protein assembly factor BamB
METTAVIDLGGDWTLPRDTPPQVGRWRVWWRGWLRRGVIAVTPLLILVLGGGGAAQPALRWVATLPTVSGDTFELTGDRIFVFHRPQADSGAVITAYSLPRGAPLWTATLPGGRADAIQLVPSAGILLAWSSNAEQSNQGVAALDQDTGRVLWRIADAATSDLRPESGRMLLTTSGSAGTTTIRMVDLRSGQPVWSQSPPPAAKLAVVQTSTGEPSEGRILLQTPDGTTQVLDENTGKVLTTGKLPMPPATPESSGPGRASLTGVGDQLLVTEVQLSNTVITAYGLSNLTQRWQVTVPVRAYGVSPCGPVLCVQGDDGVAALDPPSGTIRWQNADFAGAWPMGPWLQTIANDTRGEQRAIVRPLDGQTLLNLARWLVLSPSRPSAPALLVTDQPGRLGAWIGVLDTPPLAIRPLGWLPDAIRDQCRTSLPTPTYLACGIVHGQIRIWEYWTASG